VSEPLLDVGELSHHFAGRAEISFGSFTLSVGTILLVRGASGCGKSTLLHLLGGVLPIGLNCGSATLNKLDVGMLSSTARDRMRPLLVGWMPQRQFMINSLSVIENVLLPMSLADAVDDTVRDRAAQLLKALAIPELSNQRPATLSVGQAARVCLARALLAEPKLLLADEPTAALDEASSRLVATQIIAFTAAGGAAIVVSHDPQLRTWLSADGAANFSALELPR
jgi:putative ABC transport system ATP-binding protein